MDVFEDYSFLIEKQRLKPKNSSSLKFFASFDTLLDPRGAKVKNEMVWEANSPVCIICALVFYSSSSGFLHLLSKNPWVPKKWPLNCSFVRSSVRASHFFC